MYPEDNRNGSQFDNWNGDAQGMGTMGYHRPGAAITSMVLGICSVSLFWYPFITSIPCLIMGIVARSLAKREYGLTDPRYNGFLKAGKITGTIGVILSIVSTAAFFFFLYAVRNY